MPQADDDCLLRLQDRLRADVSADAPPWASSAIAYVPRCGARAELWLQQQAAAHDKTSFLALEALRIKFPAAWAAIPPSDRAATYAQNLADVHWFNAWGQPEEKPSETGQALIDLGVAAIPALAPLLDSRRPAQSYGSEEATISRQKAYRVCDYAWMFIARIERNPGPLPVFSQRPEERDPMIDAMKARLARK